MAGTGTVSHVSAYIETTRNVGSISFVGSYLETKINSMKIDLAGAYIEVNYDASPIIVSTDGEESAVFGVVVR